MEFVFFFGFGERIKWDSVMKGLIGAMPSPRIFGLEPPLINRLDGTVT